MAWEPGQWRGRAQLSCSANPGMGEHHALPLGNQKRQAWVVAAPVLKHRPPIVF